jgi:energy-coupling factor transporter ATP-binding protein EcfA2
VASSRPPKNLQDILRQRQQSDFVGREDYLASFYENIKLSPNHPNRQFLVNVWGQGGVGKSTLLRQFTKIAQETQAVIAHTDENEVNILDMLGHLAQQFEKQGLKFHTFSERYRLFRQKKQELEADPDAPIGLSALVGKAAVKASVKLGKRVPVGGVVLDFFDEDSLYAQAEEWASYVAKKLRNQDEVQLLQEPVNTLTALFLQDLGKISTKVPILIFFDTYEETGQFLDDWLRNVILGKCGAVHINIIIRQFKSEVHQRLIYLNRILQMVFYSQATFSVYC